MQSHTSIICYFLTHQTAITYKLKQGEDRRLARRPGGDFGKFLEIVGLHVFY